MRLNSWLQAEVTTSTQENPRPGALMENSRDLLFHCHSKRCLCSGVYLLPHTRGCCLASLPPISPLSPSPSHVLVTSSHRASLPPISPLSPSPSHVLVTSSHRGAPPGPSLHGAASPRGQGGQGDQELLQHGGFRIPFWGILLPQPTRQKVPIGLVHF